MFEIEWKGNKSVYRNLLQIKGVSKALSLKICALLGVSCNTIYSKLSSHKVDQLNQLLSIYRKKTSPFIVKGSQRSLESLGESPIENYNYWNIYTSVSDENNGHSPKLALPLESGAIDKAQLSSGLLHTPILSNLDEFKKENIKMLINLNTYRGRRFKQGYPVKGQRTRSNARTARKLYRIHN